MGFLSVPGAAIAAGITLPLLVALYLLKRQRRRVVISSTLLWSKVVKDLHVNKPFERLRRNLLLLLGLLIVMALSLALARPTTHTTVTVGERLILLLDHSASMNATDVTPTRLEQAKRLAIELVESLTADDHPNSGGAMVVSFADRPRVVQPFTNDQALLRRAIRSIQPTDLPTQLTPALRLIEPLLVKPSGLTNTPTPVVYVLSDGRSQDAVTLPDAAVGVKYIKVGHASDNVAIVSLAGRHHPQQPHRVSVLARLANFGAAPVNTNLLLALDGHVQRVVPVALEGLRDETAGQQVIRFELDDPGSGWLELRLDRDDPLPADNTAWMMFTPPRQRGVLLVSSGNPFLAQAVQAIAGCRLTSVTPNQYEQQVSRASSGAGTPYDAIVFDRYQPSTLPPTASLFVAAVPPLDRLRLHQYGSETAARRSVLTWKHNHPVMAHVALDDLRLAQRNRLALPDTAEVLAVGQDGPLIATVTDRLHQHVVVAFDILKSNWPLQIGFPIFIHNCLQWLWAGNDPVAAWVTRPGQSRVLPDHGTGQAQRYTNKQGAEGPPWTRVGLYRAVGVVPSPWHRVGVSLLNEQESHLGPVDEISLTGSAATRVHSTAVQTRKEIWWWFAAAALVLLMIEWIVYTRHLHG